MTREEFQQLCRTKIVFLDGATGTNLQKAGMPTGVCPEAWILEHPDTMMQLQRAYFEAGSDIVLAPTFTANRIKLDEYGLVDKIEEMNHQLVAISKEAAGDKGLVAGDMTMTGRQLALWETWALKSWLIFTKSRRAIWWMPVWTFSLLRR